MSPLERDVYMKGRIAKDMGKAKHACPYGWGEARLMNWWLAGWHDMEIEENA